jgi:hypothetical protein
MPYYFFAWDDEAERHLAANGVTPEEFQSVLENPHREAVSRSSGQPIAFGWTTDGRYLACVYDLVDEVIRPVTAYEIEEPQK